VIN
ncbi:NQR2, RnfD, RnfE family protein, partial [Vibrio parahaemolyticus V-223/04]|jgi:hypothetical protein